MIWFVRSASQFGNKLIVDIVVIERVEALAVVSNGRKEGRIKAEQMIRSSEHMTYITIIKI